MSTSNKCKLWFAPTNPPQTAEDGAEEGSDVASDYGLDVRQFQVNEEISSLWTATVVGLTSDHAIPLEKMIGRAAAFSLEMPNRSDARVWAGVCMEVVQLTSMPGGKSEYRVTIRHELHLLGLRRNTRIFQHVSIPEIVLQILAEWGFKVAASKGEDGKGAPGDGDKRGPAEGKPQWTAGEVEVLHFNAANNAPDQFPKFEYRVQYEETDLDFITRLLEEAGISFYFRYRNETTGTGRQSSRLVLDFQPHLTDPRAGKLHYRGTDDEDDAGKTVDFAKNASVVRNLRPGRITLRDHDFRLDPARALQGMSNIAEEKSAPPDFAHEGDYEQYDYTSGALHIDQRTQDIKEGDGKKRVADPEFRRGFNLAHATHAAKLELASIRNDALRADFETNALDVAPGTVVMMEPDDGGAPLRAELRHRLLVVATQISGRGAGTEQSGASSTWTVSCNAVPAQRVIDEQGALDFVPFVPTRKTPRTRIPGVQSATVVGPPGEEIWCDEFGRVRVQFHWDRQHKFGAPVDNKASPLVESMSSCWVRVAQPWAGTGYGFITIPRVGQEVLIQFLDGDPDQPLIVGSVYNQRNEVPYKLPDNKTVSGWKSDSSKVAGGRVGYNEIAFEDKQGKELLRIQAQKDLDCVVKNNESANVGASRATRIGATDTLDVGKTWELAVGPDQTGIVVDASSIVKLKVGGKAGAEIILAKDSIWINAMGNVHVHAGAGIHLSAGGEVRIDGAVVNVNCDKPGGAVNVPAFRPAGGPAPGDNNHRRPAIEGGVPMPAPLDAMADEVKFEAPPVEEEDDEDSDEGDEFQSEMTDAPPAAAAAARATPADLAAPNAPAALSSAALPPVAAPPLKPPSELAAMTKALTSNVTQLASIQTLMAGPPAMVAGAKAMVGDAVGAVVASKLGMPIPAGVLSGVLKGGMPLDIAKQVVQGQLTGLAKMVPGAGGVPSVAVQMLGGELLKRGG